MGKKLIAADLHFSTKSSIVTKMRDLYSEREINCINSLNWVEDIAEQYGCDEIIYAGDTFDKADLTARELTALQEVQWSNIKHSFLVGNHEGLTKDLNISSAHLFKMIPNANVISKPEIDIGYGYYLMYLPYITESDRKSINEYFKYLVSGYFTTQEVKKLYVVSHNDIKMHYGAFESTNGFEIEDIENNCDLFLNGHLHNGSKFCKNGYNIGNLTGQNFGEDATKYKHQICILDTNTGELEWLENPFAFNFYKLEFTSLNKLNNFLSTSLKHNSVLTIKVPESIAIEARKLVDTYPNNIIKASRVISIPDSIKCVDENVIEDVATQLSTMNHLDTFIHYIKENLDINDIVLSELSEVCRDEN